jgi:hypothetical protein
MQGSLVWIVPAWSECENAVMREQTSKIYDADLSAKAFL